MVEVIYRRRLACTCRGSSTFEFHQPHTGRKARNDNAVIDGLEGMLKVNLLAYGKYITGLCCEQLLKI